MRGHDERLPRRVIGHGWAPPSTLKENKAKWSAVGGQIGTEKGVKVGMCQ